MGLTVLLPYLSALLAAVLSGIISFVSAVKKSSSDIRQLKAQNELDITKLMNQHKLDLEAIQKKHELELETKEKEHGYKLEILEKENQNTILRMQQEQKNNMESSLMQGLSGGFGNMLSGVFDNPEIKEQLNQSIRQSMIKPK